MTISRSEPRESRIDTLERLDRLHRSGALTDAEFEAEKAKLLAREAPPTAGRRHLWLILLAVAGVLLVALAAYSMFLAADEAPVQIAPPPKQVEAPSPPEPVGVRTLNEAEQLARAGAAAFGSRTGTTVAVATGDDYGGDSFEEQIAYRPGTLVWAPFGPVLLSEGEVVDAAHASAGKIAAHYLRENGDTFALVTAYPKAVVTGSSGRVGEWSASDAFLAAPVLYAQGGGTWQGYSCLWGSLTELTAQGPREVARFPLAYDSQGALGDNGEAIDGKIANIVKGRSFDIVYSGARSLTERYVYENGRFTLQGGGESRMESC